MRRWTRTLARISRPRLGEICGLALCAAALATTACKKDGAADGASPTGSPQAVSAPAPLGEPVIKRTDPGAVQVRLVDAGSLPRRVLSYRFSDDMRGDMVMEMRMRMALTMGPQEVPEIKLPPVRVTMKIGETSLLPGGNLRYKAVWDHAEVVANADTPTQLREGLEAEYAGLNGMAMTAEVTPTGVVEELGVALPATASQQARQLFDSMEQALRQIMAPLPTEAVGSGASWTVTTQVDTPALKVSQEAVYHLRAIEGDTLVLELEITQTAPPQVMQPPGLPPGTKVHLDRLDSKGSGKSRLDLTSLIPRISLTLSSSMEMTVDAGEEHQSMKMKMGIEADMGPATTP